jgi:glycosyltransferase involved in cell wall biosynthesis
MKICYLANTGMPSRNASAIQIVKMCEAFSKLNSDVTLITTNASRGNIFNYYDIKTKFKLKKIKCFKKFPLGIKFYLFSIFSIIESLKSKPDIYITRNFFTCFLLILLKKKTIIELHHDLKSESRIVRFIINNFDFLNSKYLLKLIAITKYVKNHYISKYPIKSKKIIILPSGSSIKENYQYKINKKKFNIGYFGSLYKSRGLDLIIKLALIDPKNNYYVYGNKRNIKISISKKSENNLYLNDYIPYKNISKILLNMDLLLMPYTSSITVAGDVGDITKFTSPLKLFDYLCVGRPIICSNFNVLKEIIANNKNAIFVKNYKNAFAWRKEITKLINNREKMKIISKNNYKLSKKYSHIARASKILDLVK